DVEFEHRRDGPVRPARLVDPVGLRSRVGHRGSQDLTGQAAPLVQVVLGELADHRTTADEADIEPAGAFLAGPHHNLDRAVELHARSYEALHDLECSQAAGD